MPSPLTESLVVHWPATLDYHLRRLDLLAELKADGRLHEFLVRPEAVGVRTETTQLTLSEDGLALQPRGSLSTDETVYALRAALRCAAPLTFRFDVIFQFVVPIDGPSYDEARTSALERMSIASTGAYDFAVLTDGKVGEDEWHCEFGIVSDSEAPSRLLRQVGRMREFAGGLSSFVGLPQEFAPVSLFADVIWNVADRDAVNENVDDIATKILSLRDEADRLVAAIHTQLCHGSLQPTAEGADS